VNITRRHFVVFYSPGTFVAESAERSVEVRS